MIDLSEIYWDFLLAIGGDTSLPMRTRLYAIRQAIDFIKERQQDN